MVSDRETISLLRFKKVLCRNTEVLKNDSLVVGMLECPQTVLAKLEVLVFFVRKIANQDSGLVVDQADEADGPPRNDISDEEFFTVDHIVITVEHCSSL